MIQFRTADAAERAKGSTGNTRSLAPGRPLPPANGYPGRDMRVVNPGVDTASLARMYGQRVPTGPVAARPSGPTVGPRGTTIADVAEVAAGNTQKARVPSPAAAAPPVATGPTFDPRKALEGMIGGPAPGYGEKYGGMPSASYFESAVRGDMYNMLMAGELAAEEAARLAQPAQQAYETQLDPWQTGTLARRRLEENRRIANTPLQALAGQMAGGTPSAQDLYGANMARMNAVRGTGDFGKSQMDINAINMATPAAEAQLQRDLQASGALTQAELADLIAQQSQSDILQQIAIQRYGLDPALAAGLFPISENLDYQNMLNDAAKAQKMQEYPGLNPDATLAEMILMTEGPDALMEWQDGKVQDALYGSPETQLAAEKARIDTENALLDDSIRQQYGFDPKTATEVDADYVRDLIFTPEFQDIYDKALEDLDKGENAQDLAVKYAQEYLEKTSDYLGATAIGEIIASFDLSYFE